METCEDRQAAYLEGDPTAAEHMASCGDCQAQQAELDEIRALLRDPDLWAEPPDDLEVRVVDAVTLDWADATPGGKVIPIGEAHAKRRARGAAWLIAAAAAVAGLLGGAALTAGLGRGPKADFSRDFAATAAAPSARGVVHLRSTNSGIEIKLDVHGLPRVPENQYYEAWLGRPGELVPIGTFHTGDGTVTLWSGVFPKDYPTLTVTLEDRDGDPASSGRRMLTADITP